MTSPLERYKARPGVKNEGEDYEFEMAALLALRCLRLTKNVSIVVNAEGVGNFDDIILMVTTDNDIRYDFLLQLKHKGDPNNLTPRELTGREPKLPFKKYCKDMVALREALELPTDQEIITKHLGTFGNAYFVLFTNRGMDMDKFGQNHFPFYELAKDDDQMPLLKSLLNTHHGTDCVFKFVPAKIPPDFSTEDADNFTNFRLFTNQINLKDVRKKIADEIRAIAPSSFLRRSEKEIADVFIMHVKSWANGELGGNHYLTKDEILFKLTELYLSPFEVPLRPEPFEDYDSERKNVWNELVLDKAVTVVDSDETVSKFMVQFVSNEVGKYCKGFSGNWTDKLSDEQRQSFYEDHGHLQDAMLKTVTNNGEITLEDIYKCLWRAKKLPLLLKVTKSEEYDNILDILQLSGYSHRVVILNGALTPLPEKGDVQTFQTLQDLDGDEKERVLNQPAKLQGRPLKELGDLLDEAMFEDMKSRDIIHLLSDTFSIGEKIATLPRYFIHRNTSKVFLKSQVLQDAHEDEVFLINNPLASYPTKSIITDEEQIDELEDFKNIHYCSSYTDDYIEWNRTLGSTANIRSSKVALADVFQSDISRYFSNHTNIISEVPGMGKSVMMDHIAARTPTTTWVLRVDLNKHLDYYRKTNPNTKAAKHLDHFFNEQDETLVAQRVFEKLLPGKEVVVLLDGFDEISIAYTEQVTKIAKSLQQEGYRVWVTTRPHMKDHLEKALNTFAITLQPFTDGDQKKFLMDYFGDKNKELVGCEARLEEFVDRLLEATKKNLYGHEEKFTGVPLQTELLANYFQEKCTKCLSHTRPITFNKKFDLLDLYQNIVNKMVEGLDTKFSPAALEETDKCRKDQPWLALQLVFQLEDFEEVEEIKNVNKYYRKRLHKKQHLQRDGVITIDEKFNIGCTHRTFAEFLAAQWLAANLDTADAHLEEFVHDLIKQRFTQNYQFLFNVFDRILAKDCELHMAIINKQLTRGKTVDTTPACKLDAGRRTVLHLLALYGDQRALEILDNNPKVQKLISKRDRLGFTALDYALANKSSLALANTLCAHPNLAPINAYVDPTTFCPTLTECQNSGLELLPNLLLPYFASRDLLQDKQPKSATMKKYLRKDKTIASNPGCIKISLLKTILDFMQTKEGGAYSKYASSTDHYADLRYAIRFGTDRNLAEAVSKCKDINQKDVDNNTALHYAVISQNLQSVRMLLEKGANINKRNLNLHSPLHMSFDRENMDIIKLLLSKNPNLNLSDRSGQNALHYAVKRGDYGIVKELIEKGAVDVNKQDKLGNIPLLLALQQSRMDVAALLLANGSDLNILNNDNQNALHYVIRFDDENVIDKRLFENVDKNVQDVDGNTPLHLELKNKDISVDTVRFLIETGADVNVQNEHKATPLHLTLNLNSASLNGTVGAIIDLLFDHGANVNIKNSSDESAIYCAIKHGSADVVAVVPKLLSTFQDVNQRDYWDDTCLHLAARNDYREIAQELVSRGADLGAVNGEKETPLHLATRSGFISTMEVLLAEGAPVNSRDKSGNTPLHLGVTNGHVRAVELLVAKGANVNASNKGKIPLDLARGDREMIAALCPHGKGGNGTFHKKGNTNNNRKENTNSNKKENPNNNKKENTNNRRRARKNPTY